MPVMGEMSGDILEMVYRLVKRAVIGLLYGLFELLVEVVFGRLVDIAGQQQRYFYRLTGTSWVSVPLALLSFLLTLATPIVLLIGAGYFLIAH